MTFPKALATASAAFVVGAARFSIRAELRGLARPGALTTDLLPVPADAQEVSLTGDYPGGCGQCGDTIRNALDDLDDSTGDAADKLRRVLDIWDAYHLGGMHAGTTAQTAFLAKAGPFKDADAYAAKKVALIDAGLEPDAGTAARAYRERGDGQPVPPYSYGSAWLWKPQAANLWDELAGLLAELEGAFIGAAPSPDDLPSLTDEYVSAADFAERLDGLRAWAAQNPDDDTWIDDLAELETVEAAVSSSIENGETFIREDCFTDSVKDLAKDIGAVGENADWVVIDWAATAERVKVDYSSVILGGRTYWVRDC